MGRASKWIRNFLVGKREQKYKKIDASFPAEYAHNKTECQPGIPKTRRRWSFGRASGKKTSHKYSKSFDSFDTTKLPVQTGAENEVLQNHAVLIADVEYAAATKIQAVFRSYLARKALSALRGLVKLQALVRGHQVRKQTNATLRRMHALISIQVRARVQRIQMAEEAHLHVKKQQSIHRNFTLENELRRMRREKMDMTLQDFQGVSKCKSGYLNHSQIEKTEDDFPSYYSEDLSSRRRENPYEEYSFTANNSPQHYIPTSELNPRRAPSPSQQLDCANHMSHGHDPFIPNYMAKTESSSAKVRSQSEPKQRPNGSIRQKNRRRE
ncbi:protein IQ-DOMAIN 14-like, partial [Juglans microcarpa x Juglans regia]|uniref:protein IQ-DOMAIN 14-like n=1 Tax=Juglans microcarpa x Juglans regia TaxID=2249226 RepID=UPI001B7D9D5D